MEYFPFPRAVWFDGAAIFTPEPLGPFWSISSSELVTGSACGEVKLGWVLPSLDPSVGSPLSM